MASLDSLSKQLKENNDDNVIGHERSELQLNQLNEQFSGFFKYMKQQQLDALERSREASKGKSITAARGAKKDTDSSGFPDIALAIPSLKTLIAAAAAFGLALAGLRGWEVDAIKNIKGSLTKFTDGFKIGSLKLLDDAKTGLLKTFGNILTTIRGGIVRYVNLILDRLGILKFEQLRDRAGKFTGERLTPLNKIGKFFDNVIEVLKPVSKIAATLGKIAFFPLINLLGDIGKIFGSIGAFAGGKTMSLVGDLAGKFGKFAGLAAKILKPIGFIFSFVEGMNEAFKTEGDLIDKISAGVSRFLADFFGAPLDLLKELGAWILKKMGFDKEAESLKKFSIEDFLFDTLQGIFGFLKKLFSDPVGTGKEIMGSLIDSVKAMFYSVIRAVAAGFGITLKSEEEKAADANLDAANSRVNQLQNSIAAMTRKKPVDNSRALGQVTRAEVNLDEQLSKYGAGSKQAEEARERLAKARDVLGQRKADQYNNAMALKAAAEELATAKDERAKAAAIVAGHVGDNNTYTNVSNTQPISLANGVVVDRSDMLLD